MPSGGTFRVVNTCADSDKSMLPHAQWLLNLLHPADLADDRSFGDTEALCGGLGAALLIARAAAFAPAANPKPPASLFSRLLQAAVQLACVWVAPVVEPGAPSPAPSAVSTPGGGAGCPEVERLLEATVACAGQWAGEHRGGDEAVPEALEHACWLRNAVAAMDATVRSFASMICSVLLASKPSAASDKGRLQCHSASANVLPML
jgi:hypothetical protein